MRDFEGCSFCCWSPCMVLGGQGSRVLPLSISLVLSCRYARSFGLEAAGGSSDDCLQSEPKLISGNDATAGFPINSSPCLFFLLTSFCPFRCSLSHLGFHFESVSG
eukprot:TRINITY_DN12132_c0_g1_i3.p2 TRINITY_DN12132_c0_g1~~TRINITY_DN12132_c0_g1_i3.p2  ORF type:complete len:106 (+),score=2.93 TRINITY_DN12132_c0_g1_i3:64-381(+)